MLVHQPRVAVVISASAPFDVTVGTRGGYPRGNGTDIKVRGRRCSVCAH